MDQDKMPYFSPYSYPLHYKQLKRAVWIQTSFLGDVVLALGALRTLKTCSPHVKQALVISKQCAGLFDDPSTLEALEEACGLSEVIIYDKKDGSGLKSIFNVRKKIHGFLSPHTPSQAAIFQPHLSLRSTLLSALSPYRTFRYQEAAIVGGQTPRLGVYHEAKRVALLLERIGIPREEIIKSRPYLPLHTKLPVAPTHSGAAVGLAPGSVWGTKRWPIESFIELAHHLRKQYDLVLLGSTQEKELTDQIEKSFEVDPPQSYATKLFNLGGKLGLNALPQAILQLDLLICNDSAPTHLASALNIPTLALFGPTHPAMGFGPQGKESHVIHVADLKCRPCGLHGHHQCPQGHFQCMKNIQVSEVLAKALEILKK